MAAKKRAAKGGRKYTPRKRVAKKRYTKRAPALSAADRRILGKLKSAEVRKATRKKNVAFAKRVLMNVYLYGSVTTPKGQPKPVVSKVSLTEALKYVTGEAEPSVEYGPSLPVETETGDKRMRMEDL